MSDDHTSKDSSVPTNEDFAEQYRHLFTAWNPLETFNNPSEWESVHKDMYSEFPCSSIYGSTSWTDESIAQASDLGSDGSDSHHVHMRYSAPDGVQTKSEASNLSDPSNKSERSHNLSYQFDPMCSNSMHDFMSFDNVTSHSNFSSNSFSEIPSTSSFPMHQQHFLENLVETVDTAPTGSFSSKTCSEQSDFSGTQSFADITKKSLPTKKDKIYNLNKPIAPVLPQPQMKRSSVKDSKVDACAHRFYVSESNPSHSLYGLDDFDEPADKEVLRSELQSRRPSNCSMGSSNSMDEASSVGSVKIPTEKMRKGAKSTKAARASLESSDRKKSSQHTQQAQSKPVNKRKVCGHTQLNNETIGVSSPQRKPVQISNNLSSEKKKENRQEDAVPAPKVQTEAKKLPSRSSVNKRGASRRSEKSKHNVGSRRKDREQEKDVIGQFMLQLGNWLCFLSLQLSTLTLQFARFLFETCSSIIVILWSLAQEYIAERLMGKLAAWFTQLRPYICGFCLSVKHALFSRPDVTVPAASGSSEASTGVQLPTTGEEAIKRLLSLKGRDAYSILGVSQKASDKEIHKYYKKQAILVHPDKNKQAGAEEAFKILGHAFSLIGDPAKRVQYDNETLNQEELHSEWEDIRTKFEELQEKLREARNLIPCSKCSGTHSRIPVERNLYEARYCKQCQRSHSVKEGEVWAETTWLGFRWHYFACMDGKVFNITPWAQCQHEVFEQVRPHTHAITLKIQPQKARSHPRQGAGLDDYLDLLNQVIHGMQHGADPGEPSVPPGFPGKRSAPSGASSSTSHRRTRKKRR